MDNNILLSLSSVAFYCISYDDYFVDVDWVVNVDWFVHGFCFVFLNYFLGILVV